MVAIYTAHDVIDPRETRNWLIRMLVHRMRLTGGLAAPHAQLAHSY